MYTFLMEFLLFLVDLFYSILWILIIILALEFCILIFYRGPSWKTLLVMVAS